MPVPLLSADATHRAGGGLEVGFADVVAGFFLGNDAVQPFIDLLVGTAIAEEFAQVVLDDAEEAGADFAVGGQADAVAVAAEGFAHGGDDADFPAAVGEAPALGGGGGVIRVDGFQIETR